MLILKSFEKKLYFIRGLGWVGGISEYVKNVGNLKAKVTAMNWKVIDKTQ